MLKHSKGVAILRAAGSTLVIAHPVDPEYRSDIHYICNLIFKTSRETIRSIMQVVKPLQVQAYESLKEMIKDGRLEPDTIYSETKTSRSLGLSRTPMRDAIQRLAQEGYIDVIPSKGFRVHKMTEQDLVETYQIRCALEGFCAVHFANSADEPETRRVLHVLESILREMDAIASTTGDIEEFARYDAEFHRHLVYSLNSSAMSDTFDAFYYRMNLQTLASLRAEGRLKQTVAEHKAILDGMKAGDIGRSYMAAITHIGQAKNLIEL